MKKIVLIFAAALMSLNTYGMWIEPENGMHMRIKSRHILVKHVSQKYYYGGIAIKDFLKKYGKERMSLNALRALIQADAVFVYDVDRNRLEVYKKRSILSCLLFWTTEDNQYYKQQEIKLFED